MTARLTPESIATEVDRIRRLAEVDPEVAHSMEDKLHVATLNEIASGLRRGGAALAEAALESTKIDFPRWSA